MRECVECGAPIPATKKPNAITCSIQCRAERSRRLNRDKARAHYARTYVKLDLPERTCEYCGTSYKPVRVEQKFCTRGCMAGFHQRKKLGRSDVRSCYKCGTEVTKTGPGLAVCDACRADPRTHRHDHEQRRRLRKYGVTDSWYAAQLAAQGGRCAICGTTDPMKGTRKQGTWNIDHDHDSGAVRGLLCARCNPGLGHFEDDPDLLLAAAAYVERYRTTQQRRTA